MSTGLKANSDGSAAIQVGGTDVITLTSGGAATFVTSPTTVQAGTAAAPSITFSGDTNTGIYSPGADTIAFTEGGVESMRISALGTLMVNTTTESSVPTPVKMLANSASNTALQLNTGTSGGAVYSNNIGAGFRIYSYTGALGSETYTLQLSNDGAARTVALRDGTLSNGVGIAFPATQSASSDANTLDDYEEGTFTPTLAGGFSSGPTSYLQRTGSYTKVGRFVYFQLDMDAAGATANASHVQISGLPFTSMTPQDGFGGANLSYQESFNTNAGDSYHISFGSTTISVYTNAGLTRNGNSAGVNINGRIILFGCYQTA